MSTTPPPSSPTPDPNRDLRPIRAQRQQMALDLLQTAAIDLASANPAQRQLIAMFTFGMAFGASLDDELNPAQTHALAIAWLMDAFNYTEKEAVSFAQRLINASANRETDEFTNTVIHRGIEGYIQWRNEEHTLLGQNIQEVLAAIG